MLKDFILAYTSCLLMMLPGILMVAVLIYAITLLW